MRMTEAFSLTSDLGRRAAPEITIANREEWVAWRVLRLHLGQKEVPLAPQFPFSKVNL